MRDIPTIDYIIEQAMACGFDVDDATTIPERPATRVPPPEGLSSKLQEYLNSAYPEGLYAHQSNAIAAALAGRDICLATSTASGKSLVFISVAANLVQKRPA